MMAILQVVPVTNCLQSYVEQNTLNGKRVCGVVISMSHRTHAAKDMTHQQVESVQEL